jgi:hypothetical protein
MKLKPMVLIVPLVGSVLLASCSKQVKDDEARKYVRDELTSYLDSLTYQLCEVKYVAALAAPGRQICPGKGTPGAKAPPNGAVGTGTDKDSEVRKYIRDDLQPWLDSVSYQLCQIKSVAAPTAPGRFICTGGPDGYKKPPANGSP